MEKKIISLRFKLSAYFFVAGASTLLIMRLLAPALLHRELIKEARESNYRIYTEKISDFLRQNDYWGTPETARAFFESLNRTPPLPDFSRGEPLRPSYIEENLTSSVKISPLYSIGLSDMNGNTLIPFKGLEPGDKVPDQEITRGDAIYFDGSLVAYAFPDGTPPIADEDRLMLNRLDSILGLGFNVSLLIALVSGLVLGTRLTTSIRKLTEAAESLKTGLEGQQITDITSRDEIGKLAQVINEMSLELEESHNKIKELAIRDELTGLYNRRFFNHEMKMISANAIRHSHHLAVVLGDVDFFKKVNDDFSHQTGDSVLKQLATILTTGVREGDLVARYGGEEIILAFPETDLEESHNIVERLRQEIEEYDWTSIARGLKITMSFGICCSGKPENFEKMTAKADENLYKAKRTGRNRCISSSLV